MDIVIDSLNTPYQLDTPYDLIVSDRINELKSYYGKDLYLHYRFGRDYSQDIELHISNLILTYDQNTFDNMFDLIYDDRAQKVS